LRSATENGLPLGIDRKIVRDELRQLFRNIAPHAVIFRERLFGRIHIEARAKPKIIGVCGIAGHVGPARRGVGRDKYQAELRAGAAVFAFLRGIGMRAGKPGQIIHHRQFHTALVLRYIDRESHVGLGLLACMLVNALHAAMRFVE